MTSGNIVVVSNTQLVTVNGGGQPPNVVITDEQWNPPTLGFYLQNSGGSGYVILSINYEGASGDWEPIHVPGYTSTWVNLDFSNSGAPNEFASCTGPYFCCPYPPGPDSSPPSVWVMQVMPDNAATTENQVIYETESNYNAYTSTGEIISSGVLVQAVSQPTDAGVIIGASVFGGIAAIGYALSSTPTMLGNGAPDIVGGDYSEDQLAMIDGWNDEWNRKQAVEEAHRKQDEVIDQFTHSDTLDLYEELVDGYVPDDIKPWMLEPLNPLSTVKDIAMTARDGFEAITGRTLPPTPGDQSIPLNSTESGQAADNFYKGLSNFLPSPVKAPVQSVIKGVDQLNNFINSPVPSPSEILSKGIGMVTGGG